MRESGEARHWHADVSPNGPVNHTRDTIIDKDRQRQSSGGHSWRVYTTKNLDAGHHSLSLSARRVMDSRIPIREEDNHGERAARTLEIRHSSFGSEGKLTFQKMEHARHAQRKTKTRERERENARGSKAARVRHTRANENGQLHI